MRIRNDGNHEIHASTGAGENVSQFENFVEHEHYRIEPILILKQKEIIRRLYSDGLTKPSLIVKSFENEDEEY